MSKQKNNWHSQALFQVCADFTLCAAADIVAADLSELLYLLAGCVGMAASVICKKETNKKTGSVILELFSMYHNDVILSERRAGQQCTVISNIWSLSTSTNSYINIYIQA